MGVTTYDVLNARVGPDLATASRNMGGKPVTITSTGTTTDFFVDLPVGSFLQTILVFTPTAATGTPTNANLTVGKTLGGAEYVAATDIKAAGKIALTFANTNLADMVNLPATAGLTGVGGTSLSRVYLRLTFVGGTAPTLTGAMALVEATMPYTAPADGRGL